MRFDSSRVKQASKLLPSFGMQPIMAERGGIRTATAGRDDVHWEELIAIAFSGLGLGLALVVGLAQFTGQASQTETSIAAASHPDPNAKAVAAPESLPATRGQSATNDEAALIGPATTPRRDSQPPRSEQKDPTGRDADPTAAAAADSALALDSKPVTPHQQHADQTQPPDSTVLPNRPTPLADASSQKSDASAAKAPGLHPALASTERAAASRPPKPHATNAANAAANSGKTNRRAKPRRFEFGLVVYSRCDGLQRNDKRTLCPRDRRFELQVWDALRELTQCRSDPGVGEAELRLTFHRKGSPLIAFSAVGNARGLNLRAVSQCAGPALAKVRTRLRSPHAVVTFRFKLS